MRNFCFLFVLLMVVGIATLSMSGCKDAKKDLDALADSLALTDTLANDTDSVADDTPLSEMEKLMGEKPMPEAADELFDDFFFNFSNNRKVQRERILWPLVTIVNGVRKTTEENKWQMERFYSTDGFYVMLLDDVKQTKLAKDTALNNAVVKHVNIPRNSLENFTFNRINGQWMMTEMEKEPLSESRNAAFLRFYQKFATDSVYCYESLAENISFTGPDEEDENVTITRDISADEYGYWAPELMTDFYTVSYGQKDESSNNKVFIMRQPSSSQECRMYFRRQGSQWKLYKLEE